MIHSDHCNCYHDHSSSSRSRSSDTHVIYCMCDSCVDVMVAPVVPLQAVVHISDRPSFPCVFVVVHLPSSLPHLCCVFFPRASFLPPHPSAHFALLAGGGGVGGWDQGKRAREHEKQGREGRWYGGQRMMVSARGGFHSSCGGEGGLDSSGLQRRTLTFYQPG